jgi:hypothetical protein
LPISISIKTYVNIFHIKRFFQAMVRALKATGATAAEIAKTMQQALEKTGASQEEIARMMAKAMADAGATRKSNVITEKGFN